MLQEGDGMVEVPVMPKTRGCAVEGGGGVAEFPRYCFYRRQAMMRSDGAPDGGGRNRIYIGLLQKRVVDEGAQRSSCRSNMAEDVFRRK